MRCERRIMAIMEDPQQNAQRTRLNRLDLWLAGGMAVLFFFILAMLFKMF